MNDFRIKTSVLGPVSTNCYTVYNCATGEGVIVDPGDNAEYIEKQCRQMGITPKAILLTHGHFDHMLAADSVREAFGIPIYVSEQDDVMLGEVSLNLSGTCGTERMSLHGDRIVKDGEELHFLGLSWKVIATPGHTAGSVCYYIPSEEVLFAGDTLFADSYGRTDLPTGSMRDIAASIRQKLFALPEDTIVYPGHGNATTIGHEKQYNPLSMGEML